MKASVIVPAYNEGKRIAALLSRMPRGYEVVVVDDGSADNTAEEAQRCRAKVVRLPKNMGKANACLEGMRHSTHEYCVFIDGDGQHRPEDIPRIISALQSADIVIGSRNMKTVPLHRRLANWYASKAASFATGRHFPDVLSGFRGVRKSPFSNLTFKKSGYFFESEMAIEAAKHGLSVSSVPVNVTYEYGARMGVVKGLEIAAWLFAKCVEKLFA
ncbi:MAG: glycosyltransferase family 2 protein [Candidatus Aenigmarchaeota archaeon]|nr:glycosyltransferase family 2 protein [Candidatus Aenigmarchaeota archaeon]